MRIPVLATAFITLASTLAVSATKDAFAQGAQTTQANPAETRALITPPQKKINSRVNPAETRALITPPQKKINAPLPPKDKINAAATSNASKVMLNPQPLPPKAR